MSSTVALAILAAGAGLFAARQQPGTLATVSWIVCGVLTLATLVRLLQFLVRGR